MNLSTSLTQAVLCVLCLDTKNDLDLQDQPSYLDFVSRWGGLETAASLPLEKESQTPNPYMAVAQHLPVASG